MYFWMVTIVDRTGLSPKRSGTSQRWVTKLRESEIFWRKNFWGNVCCRDSFVGGLFVQPIFWILVFG
jgi:hypothetical protein